MTRKSLSEEKIKKSGVPIFFEFKSMSLTTMSFQDGSAEFTVTTEEFGFDAKTGSKLYVHGEMGIELKVLMPGLLCAEY